jgi:hypothetical protein
MGNTYKDEYSTRELGMKAAYYREKQEGRKYKMYCKHDRKGGHWRIMPDDKAHPGHGWIDAGWKRYHIPENDLSARS